jgi:N-acetylglucosamine-6-phosphate deacetylase
MFAMQSEIYKEDKVVACVNGITGKEQRLLFHDDTIIGIVEREGSGQITTVLGPGLIDLQVNGVKGIDFNNPALTENDVVEATYHLLSKGVTTFFPTVITNSDENICRIAHTIFCCMFI